MFTKFAMIVITPRKTVMKAVIMTAALAAAVTAAEARGGLPLPPAPPGLPAPPNVGIHVSGAVPVPPGAVISVRDGRRENGHRYGHWKHNRGRHGHGKHKGW